MGREAACECESNGVRSHVKAIIEPPELILRGEQRRRLPLSGLTEVRADGECLKFVCGADSYVLLLGRATAEKWVKALTAAPPSLAGKLGISATTAVRIIGEVDDDALRAAIASAQSVSAAKADLILARVNTPIDLAAALHAAKKQLAARIPIWFIYPKGKGHALSESDVRATALAAGIVDTKVCAVSTRLTALRFVRRRAAV
jgi:hypothetical protein